MFPTWYSSRHHCLTILEGLGLGFLGGKLIFSLMEKAAFCYDLGAILKLLGFVLAPCTDYAAFFSV